MRTAFATLPPEVALPLCPGLGCGASSRPPVSWSPGTSFSPLLYETRQQGISVMGLGFSLGNRAKCVSLPSCSQRCRSPAKQQRASAVHGLNERARRPGQLSLAPSLSRERFRRSRRGSAQPQPSRSLGSMGPGASLAAVSDLLESRALCAGPSPYSFTCSTTTECLLYARPQGWAQRGPGFLFTPDPLRLCTSLQGQIVDGTPRLLVSLLRQD